MLRTQRVDDSRKATKSAALDCAFRILRATHCMPHTVLSAGKAYVTGNGIDIVTQHASDGIRLTAPGISHESTSRPGRLAPIRSRGAVNHALLSRLNDVVRRYTRTRSYADPSSEHPSCLVWRTSPRFNSKEKLRAGMWDRGSDLCCQEVSFCAAGSKQACLPGGGPAADYSGPAEHHQRSCTGLTLFSFPVDRTQRDNPQERS